MNIDEQRLAERLRNGDNGAMCEFYTLYAEQMAGVCSRYITDEDDMKDVFQESLIHIITHISDFTYRGAGSLKAWATRIVVKESLRFLRDTKRHELLLLDQEVADELTTQYQGKVLSLSTQQGQEPACENDQTV